MISFAFILSIYAPTTYGHIPTMYYRNSHKDLRITCITTTCIFQLNQKIKNFYVRQI